MKTVPDTFSGPFLTPFPVQELLRNTDTGEEIVRRTLLNPDGTLFEAPHFRPFWK
jgi:hypothetical protein